MAGTTFEILGQDWRGGKNQQIVQQKEVRQRIRNGRCNGWKALVIVAREGRNNFRQEFGSLKTS
ncbi:hypothetical protein [Microcoleus sp. F4-D5]|uniref:hypothetical protein n=1 Tax=Microcoleus sp. F4-D5 TaxID=2818760 RepID=UPI002FD1FE3A